MDITSYEELQTALMGHIKKAMDSVANKAKKDMDTELKGFYTGTPVMYKRTKKLERSVMVSDIESDIDEMSFEAYIDTNYTYPSITYTYSDGSHTTSKSPSMTDVLNLTNYGTTSSSVGKLHPAIGRQGYWERAEKRIEKSLNSTMKRYFE